MGEHTAVIGKKAAHLDSIPNGLVGREVSGGTHEKRTAKGDPMKRIPSAWDTFWKNESKLNRRYTSDFEVYGSKSEQGKTSEVEIFLAVAE
jgi:predicted transcriptional regulator YdeE